MLQAETQEMLQAEEQKSVVQERPERLGSAEPQGQSASPAGNSGA